MPDVYEWDLAIDDEQVSQSESAIFAILDRNGRRRDPDMAYPVLEPVLVQSEDSAAHPDAMLDGIDQVRDVARRGKLTL